MKEETPWAGNTTSDPIRQRGDTTPSSPTARAPGRKSCELELLTESRCQVARRCLREEKLRYVDGLVPAATAESLRFGTLWHHGMEAWWSCRDSPEVALDVAREAMIDSASSETDAYELARAEVMLEGYDARWGGEQFEVLGVELEFRAPLVNPETGARSRTFERAGKLDVVVRDPTGRAFVMEHKTSGSDISAGSAWWSRLRFGGQSSGYLRGAEALGYQPIGVLYDVARKPMLRPLQANSKRAAQETVDEYRARVREDIAANPDKYFQRGLVVRLEEQMHEADMELWQLGQMLRDHHRLQIAPRNPDACERYGQTCSFFDLCCGNASTDDSQFRRLGWKHPELEETLAR